MEISGYGLFSAQEVEESERIRRNKRSGSALENLGAAGTDTVSISDEARAMYAEMKAMRSESGNTSDSSSEGSGGNSSESSSGDSSGNSGDSIGMYGRKSGAVSSGDSSSGSNDSFSRHSGDDSAKDDSAEKTGTTSKSGKASKSGASGGSSSSESSTESIQKQIDQLQAKLQNVATSGMPENAKQSTMSMYQAQIAELEQQLNQLEQSQQG